MNYWELRDIVKTIIPRRSLLEKLEKHAGLVKEKGRKSNYSQFNLETGELVPIQRLLNKDEINSFLEVSLRAAHCIVKGQSIHTNRGDKKIETIRTGNKIASFDENEKRIKFERVENVYISFRNDIYEIETDSGKIKITSDHPVFTKRGWVLAKDLIEEDEILEID
jgi:hypothetical protein